MHYQTGFYPSLTAPKLCVYSGQLELDNGIPATEPPAKQVKAPCRTSEKLMAVLEEITGWKAEFAESTASYRKRSQQGMEDEPAQGTFSIVDMSADWPANQFTAHRGKCDQLVELIGDLVGELQAAKLEISKGRSALAALPSQCSEVQEEEVLVDSFVPKFGRVQTGNVALTSASSQGSNSTAGDDEFEVLQEIAGGDGKLVPPPFEGWSLGGTTGIVDDTYLDWLVDDHERIAISVGKIESAFGDGDPRTVLKVEPLTSEYRVAAHGEIRAFYHWDVVASQIQMVQPSSSWTRLGVGDAIIASTDAGLDLQNVLAQLQSQPNPPTAETIAQAVTKGCGKSERALVLQRGNV